MSAIVQLLLAASLNYASCTGGVVTTNGNFKTHTFNSNGTLSCVIPGDMTATAWGAGGGGGDGQGSNGNAGGNSIVSGPGVALAANGGGGGTTGYYRGGNGSGGAGGTATGGDVNTPGSAGAGGGATSGGAAANAPSGVGQGGNGGFFQDCGSNCFTEAGGGGGGGGYLQKALKGVASLTITVGAAGTAYGGNGSSSGQPGRVVITYRFQ